MYIPSDNKYHQAKYIFIAEVVVLFYYEFERKIEREREREQGFIQWRVLGLAIRTIVLGRSFLSQAANLQTFIVQDIEYYRYWL